MKVAVVTSATAGGAGIAATRVADALRTHAGHEVQLADQAALGVVAAEVSPQVNVSNGRLSNTHFTADRNCASREWCVRFLSGFDVVNVHWSSYLLSVGDLQALASAGTRLLLTMHDFNTVTGGCHYPAGCTGLFAGCEGCPQVDPDLFPADGVMRAKASKMALLRHPNVHLCAPSRHVLDAAARAGAIPPGRLHLIRNPYSPVKLPDASSAERPFTVMLVADSLAERRKAAMLAGEALQQFALRRGMSDGRQLRIHVVGAAPESLLGVLRSTSAEVRVHGRITDHARLAALYAASDVQLLTSYEDNWPNVLCEAGAYGCLAVTGPGHGCEEFVRHFDGGALAAAYSPHEFALALSEVAALEPGQLADRRSALAARILRDHDPAWIARQYTQAFESIFAGPGPGPGDAPALSGPAPAAACVSSNFLGVHSRRTLGGAGGLDAGHLEVSRTGPLMAGSELTLHAAYGDPASASLARHRMTGQSLQIPLQGPAGRLRHVFAQEQSDYGLSVLRCDLRTSPSTPGADAPVTA